MDSQSNRPDGAQRRPAPQRTGQPARRPAQRSAPASGNATPRSSQSQRQPGRSPRKRSESRWFRAIVMVLATVAFCGFLAVFILQSALELFGLNQEDRQIEVTIPQNPTIASITNVLANAGVIEQSLTFRIYASIQGDEVYHPGEYVFNTNMGYDEILTALRTEDTQKEEVTITFIEGWNVYEIATKLEEERVCDAEEFLEHLQTGEFSYEFMDQLPVNALRFRKLEGYIFPDTYDFYVGENVDSVARKFLRNFDQKVTAGMRKKMLENNMTLDEAITLASVIQKETGGIGGIDEMRRVSSVFHNRMELKAEYPKLQSDVTRDYATKFIIPFHDQRNQPMYDAYNTYECEGLPVGPICSPSLDAIEAAITPDDTPYFYFVTDVEYKFYYATSLQEHNQNIATASKVEGEGEVHGIQTDRNA